MRPVTTRHPWVEDRAAIASVRMPFVRNPAHQQPDLQGSAEDDGPHRDGAPVESPPSGTARDPSRPNEPACGETRQEGCGGLRATRCWGPRRRVSTSSVNARALDATPQPNAGTPTRRGTRGRPISHSSAARSHRPHSAAAAYVDSRNAINTASGSSAERTDSYGNRNSPRLES
jgi:hypothetical protein